MAQLSNPNQDKPFDRVTKGVDGQPEYGFRRTESGEEVVHIPTGRSNMQYWKPELVNNPTGCNHTFQITDMGKREIVCSNPQCNFGLTFHISDIKEIDGKAYLLFKGKEYLLN